MYKQNVLDQFPDFLLSLSDGNGEIIVGGDFNFRFENEHDNEVCKIRSLLNDCCLKQLVNQPISSLWPHLVRDDSPIVHSLDLTDIVLSEHRTVFCKLALRKPSRGKQQVRSRNLRRIEPTSFQTDISQVVSLLAECPDSELLAECYASLSNVLDLSLIHI